MILEIRSDKKSYTEKIDLKELEDYFNELKNNGERTK